MKRKAYNISRFICSECGMVVPLPRKKSRPREDGHIKSIWCPKCGGKRKFNEVKETEFIGRLSW